MPSALLEPVGWYADTRTSSDVFLDEDQLRALAADFLWAADRLATRAVRDD